MKIINIIILLLLNLFSLHALSMEKQFDSKIKSQHSYGGRAQRIQDSQERYEEANKKLSDALQNL